MSSPSPGITVEYYGRLTAATGSSREILTDSDINNVSELIEYIGNKYDIENSLEGCVAAVNDQLSSADTALHNGDVVALLPPVSGGAADAPLHLTEAVLDVEQLVADTADERCGALVVFGGTVRNENEDQPVRGMSYTAHHKLASEAIARIEAEALQQFDIHQCRCIHRIGELALGDLSVVVVVRAAHRGPAFEAARWAIDTIKAQAAIWKEEHYVSGSSTFLDGTALKTP